LCFEYIFNMLLQSRKQSKVAL